MTIKQICEIDGTAIGVRLAENSGGQQILIQATSWGGLLARSLLGPGETLIRDNGYLVIPHNQDVDARLHILIDTFTSIRWNHPTYTQLELDLPVTTGGAKTRV